MDESNNDSDAASSSEKVSSHWDAVFADNVRRINHKILNYIELDEIDNMYISTMSREQLLVLLNNIFKINAQINDYIKGLT